MSVTVNSAASTCHPSGGEGRSRFIYTAPWVRSETAITDQPALAWRGQTWHSGGCKRIMRAPESLPSPPTGLSLLWERGQPGWKGSTDSSGRVCSVGTELMLILPRKCPALCESCCSHTAMGTLRWTRAPVFALLFSWDLFPKFSWVAHEFNPKPQNNWLIQTLFCSTVSDYLFCCIKIASLLFP